jgi:hypothetical protein
MLQTFHADNNKDVGCVEEKSGVAASKKTKMAQ